ncbi:MAG: EAL domain-containing protein [Candidatus Thiodiazotropha sp. (ex. Lucinisca nassula)]|nr:EAL domain-containing protein [Candidatus Thiodiazotropha sp. (ex. Lucinisca nassula)]
MITLKAVDTIKQGAVDDLTFVHQQLEHNASNHLTQLSAILKVLGHRISDIGLDDMKAVRETIERIISDNPAFSAYGLSTPDGNMILNSLGQDNQALPNLRENPYTRETYLKTLAAREVVLGRTYYYPPMNEFIIPLRFAIRDQAGNPIAVVSATISADSKYNPWHLPTLPPDYNISITNNSTIDNKYYSQYVYPPISKPEDKEQLYYTVPYPNHIIDQIKQRIARAAGTDFQTFMESGRSVSYLVHEEWEDADFLEVISYNDEFEFFTAISVRNILLTQSINLMVITYFVPLLLFNIILFFVLRYIDDIQKRSKKLLAHQALHDQLTQLPNRYYLDLHLTGWLNQVKAGYTVIFLDMDNFKVINDSYGHKMGDAILQVLGKRLQNHNPENTLVIRQGGDEFIFLIPDDNLHFIKQFAETVVGRLRHPININGINFSLSGSIGIAISTQHTDQLGDLLRKADLAMYEAKKERNRYAFFSDHLQQISDERSRIEDGLRYAVDNDEMHMVYQPQIETATGEIFGVESLIRWQHPAMGMVPPDKFVSVAESSSQINMIGEFVIDATLREISEVQSTHKTSFHISINVSVMQLHTSDFRRIINIKAREYGIAPSSITLEITESLFIDDLEQIRHVLMQLKRDGFKISLDDFGTGYSSLSVLNKLPIDEVKIDKSFIRDIEKDEKDLLFVESLVGIIHSLDIPSLAEGVENMSQAVALRICNCDLLQGFYFAKPMPKQELVSYLSSFTAYDIDKDSLINSQNRIPSRH